MKRPVYICIYVCVCVCVCDPLKQRGNHATNARLATV